MPEQRPIGSTITEVEYRAQRRRALTILLAGIFIIIASPLLFFGSYILFPSENGPHISFSLLLSAIFLSGVSFIFLYRRALTILAAYKVQ